MTARWLTAQGRGARGVIAITAGTAFGQLLAVAASPVLSRIYTPSNFGVFSIVSALAMIMGTGMALRYEQAVPLPADDEDARALFLLGTVLTVATTMMATIAYFLLAPTLASLIETREIEPWLLWVPLIAGAITAFQLLNQWGLRHHRYAATARRNVVSAVTTVIVQVVVGWRVAGPGGLVAGLGAGQALGAASLLHGSGLLGTTRRADLLRVARRFRRFPLLLAPAGMLNAAGVYMPLLLIAALYNAQEAGWFGFAQRLIALPVAFIGQAVAQVYLSELARAWRLDCNRQRRMFRRASFRLALVGSVSGLLVLTLSRPVFPWLFGEAWEQSGAMAQALAISLALQVLASPLSQTLVVYERISLQLCWDIGRLLLVTCSILLAASAGADALGCVWVFSVVSALAYAVLWALSRRTITRAT